MSTQRGQPQAAPAPAELGSLTAGTGAGQVRDLAAGANPTNLDWAEEAISKAADVGAEVSAFLLLPVGEHLDAPLCLATTGPGVTVHVLAALDAVDRLDLLAAYPVNSTRAYRNDLRAWANWCASLDVHPLAARRHHADAWIRSMTTEPQPTTDRPASAATVGRRLSAVAKFYDYAIHDAEAITYSPVANVRRPKVSDESSTPGLSADELRSLLAAATAHSPRSAALVNLLVLNGLRISEALGTDVRDYGYDRGHRVLRVTRKGGKAARAALAPPVVRALDAYLDGRTTGPLFLAADGTTRYAYNSAFEQVRRLARSAGIAAADTISPHSLRHSFATEALSLGAPLQDMQDALGHADPRTTRRYDRSRHNLDRSPTYLLASSLANDHPDESSLDDTN